MSFEKLEFLQTNPHCMSADAFQTLFNRWDMEVTQLMLASEKRCSKFCDGRIEFSPITGIWIRRLQAYRWIQQFHENKVAHGDREPSLAVGRGHVSWSMLGLIALTSSLPSQGKQQANQPCFSCRNSRSAKTSQIFLGTSRKWDRKKQLAKIKFCCTGVYVRCRMHDLKGCF
jgi:hypothetical protein